MIEDDHLKVGAYLQKLLKTIAMTCAIVAGTMFPSIASAQDSPLERLQKRSANERWREARNQWLPVNQVPSKLPTPFLPFPNSLPFETLQKEFPQLDSTLVDEKPNFETPIRLFDPQTPQTEVLETPKIEKGNLKLSIKPTVDDEPTEIAFPARTLAVPNPYPTQTKKTAEPPVAVPPLPKTEELGQFKLALQNTLPPALEDSPQKPILRSISDIRPFHDYVPKRDSKGDPLFATDAKNKGPKYLPLEAKGSLERNTAPTHYHWMASNLKHDSLYFEDVSLERYGHTYSPGIQPFVSVSKFGLQVAGLPYQMALNPVWCEQYALGYYRPGDCAPPLRYRIPFNKRAAATATGVYTGLLFLFP